MLLLPCNDSWTAQLEKRVQTRLMGTSSIGLFCKELGDLNRKLAGFYSLGLPFQSYLVPPSRSPIYTASHMVPKCCSLVSLVVWGGSQHRDTSTLEQASLPPILQGRHLSFPRKTQPCSGGRGSHGGSSMGKCPASGNPPSLWPLFLVLPQALAGETV